MTPTKGGRGAWKIWHFLTKGGKGARKFITIADKGGGSQANADNHLQRGGGGGRLPMPLYHHYQSPCKLWFVYSQWKDGLGTTANTNWFKAEP